MDEVTQKRKRLLRKEKVEEDGDDEQKRILRNDFI